MLISQSWITRIVDQANAGWSVDVEDFDSGFVRVGFETEDFESIPETTGPLVWGRVEDFEELEGFKKPIRYCQVNVGDANGTGELQGIICGARNFKKGSYVAVALPGAVLPGNFEISARETYGKISAGMMCAFSELGIGSVDSPGIITLTEDGFKELNLSLGEDARPALGMDDTIFDINITPDRGYALSARGLSREIAAAFNQEFKDPAQGYTALPAGLDSTSPLAVNDQEVLDVTLEEDTKVARFGLRKVVDVDPVAVTPLWMQRELLVMGQRPVNLTTDITNYVMFLLGQPLHAFDAQKITGSLTVRRATQDEKFTTLDAVERILSAEDVVIEDTVAIQSLAGVMGGMNSEISEDTTEVLFEAAHWNPVLIARTSRRHKLSTEASRRFERGVDPAIIEVALDLSARLLAHYGKGTISESRTLIGEVPARDSIPMNAQYPSDLAGVDYSAETVIKRLEEIGAGVDVQQDDLAVTPPTWRSDISEKADLVEEVLRLEGLDRIPSIIPSAPAGKGLSPRQRMRRAIGRALAWSGYAEILPTPFMNNSVLDTWDLTEKDPRRNALTIVNPLEPEYATVATTLLPAMLDSLKRNVSRGQKNVALYGVEQVTQPGESEVFSPMPATGSRPSSQEITDLLESIPRQPLHAAIVAAGDKVYQGPGTDQEAFNAYDAVDSARVIARSVGEEISIRNAEMSPWHPGRCAEITLARTGQVLGYAGELHPQVCEAMNLPARTIAMEIDLSPLALDTVLPSPMLSPYPALLQDTALVMDEKTPAHEVAEVIRSAAGDLLEDVRLFDVYRSESLGEGKKSLTFSLRFRAQDRTLTDEEANAARTAAVEAVVRVFNAEERA